MRGWLAALLGGALACEAGSFRAFDDDRECPARRDRGDDGCCPPWTSADDDVCRPSAWQRDVDDAGFGDPGAHSPAIALDDRERAIVTWTVSDNATTDVWIGEETAQGHLRTRRPTAALAGNASTPAVAVHPDGRAVVAWRQRGAPDRIFASQRPRTGGWRDPAPADALSWPGDASAPRVAFGSDGEVLVAWNQWTGREHRIVVAALTGDASGDRMLLSAAVDRDSRPQLVIADNGDAIVTWSQVPLAQLIIVASERLRTHGTWSRPGSSERLSPPHPTVVSDPPRDLVAAIDDRGSAAIAWIASQSDDVGPAPVFLATRDGHGTWSVPAHAGDTFSAPDTIARDVRIAIAGTGELHATWSEDRGDHRRIVAALRDRDAQWIAPGHEPVVLSDPGVDAIAPALAVGREGHAIVVFAARGGDGVRRIVARRHVDDRWIAAEVLSDPAAGDASMPTVAIGADSRTAVAWVQGDVLRARVHIAWLP